MKPFETVKFMKTQMLSVFADNVGEKGNRLRPCCFAENTFDKTNYNYRKAVFYI